MTMKYLTLLIIIIVIMAGFFIYPFFFLWFLFKALYYTSEVLTYG